MSESDANKSGAAPQRGAGTQPGGAAVHKWVVTKGKAVVRRPDIDTLFSVNPDGSRNVIHPADVKGRFQRLKHVMWFVLIGIYLIVPWLRIGEHPVLLLDLPMRHFYVFGYTFNAQDFWYAFFIITGVGFALFVVAALFGRMWCGYACPQTVFLEGVFRRIERLIEGPPGARAKLDKAPMSKAKFLCRGLKILVFLLLAAVISHSFLGYFMRTEVLLEAVTSSPGKHPTAFIFIVIATGALFFNFTWFREQLCIVICPYGRLQGALYDPDTVLVGYDQKRGEPRGPAGKEGAGDCVDCYRCVAVCPTGIDIRNGTQLECVGCANCIDACDDVMSKLGKPKGLVRYDSQRAFETGERRFFRGRVVLYAILLLLGISVMTFAITKRRPFEASLVRAPGRSYTLEDGRVHNVFDLQLINKRPDRRKFTIVVQQPTGTGAETLVAGTELELDSLEDRRIPVHVFVPRAEFKAGLRCELLVRCDEPGGELTRIATGSLLGPSSGR
ncbi:MAG: cytochrome c oxidase accessory protein CcoG [Planctomycetes bacterium]|nr:cytochrome c oxidase accessory protein CcoG [Planctomycetota bacterium]